MITLVKNTLMGRICLDDKAMKRARENGRSDMDCSQGEFVIVEHIYKTQFGPERSDYNLRI